MHVLDTDISIYYINGGHPSVRQRVAEADIRQLGTTAPTASELRYGALNSSRPTENMNRAIAFLSLVGRVLPFEAAAAERHAWLKHTLLRQGTPIGPMDMLIAAIALAGDHTLITNNEREFARVPGLRTENWTLPPADG